MARETRTPAPAPARDNDRRSYEQRWEAPQHDQDFIFTNIDEAPSWIDRGWASFDRGPALALPAGDVHHLDNGPYTTVTARVGDKVVFTAARGANPAKFTVIPMAGTGDSSDGTMTRRPPQVTNASLEDALKTGSIAPEDLGADAKAQVAHRTPGMRKLIEGDIEAPKPQSTADMGVKTD